MKTWRRLALLLLFVLTLPVSVGAQIPKTDAERREIFQKLPWRHGGTFTFLESKATLTVEKSLDVITGAAVNRFWEATQGDTLKAAIEAVVVNREAGDYVSFERVTEGYVSFDDWDKVKADEFIESVKKGTDKANKERQANNVSPLTVLGWVQTPTLDRQTQTVHWAIRARDDGDGTIIVNAATLVFGRYGYERIQWVGDATHDPGPFLLAMRNGFQFDRGAQYTDIIPSDKKAAYGVAALVATLVGAKVAAKIGLLAILIGIAKKMGIILIAITAGLFGLIKRLFTGKANIEENP